MKTLFVCFFFVIRLAFAQQEASPKNLVDINNPNNYKNSLVQKIVALPTQKSETKSFFSWDKSLLQIGYGQSYYRFNSIASDEQSISTFTEGGDDLNLRAQYYLFPFFSLLVDYDFTRFHVERFDGQPIKQEQRIARRLGYGIQFDLGDFILGALIGHWSKPFYQYHNSELKEDEYQTRVYSYKLGHRTGVGKVILELFYLYHDVSSFDVNNDEKFRGKLQTVGIDIFFNTQKTFGFHFSESFGSLASMSDSDNVVLEVKQFKIQPFYRF